MAVEVAIRSASLLLALVFLAAVLHKVTVLRRGGAHDEPLLARRGVGPTLAPVLLALAGLLESALIVALVLAPAEACAAAALVLLGYCLELRRLGSEDGCMCLGELFDARSRTGAIKRNVALAALASAAAAAGVVGATGVAPISEASVGVTFIAVAVLAAAALLGRQAALAGAPTGAEGGRWESHVDQ